MLLFPSQPSEQVRGTDLIVFIWQEWTQPIEHTKLQTIESSALDVLANCDSITAAFRPLAASSSRNIWNCLKYFLPPPSCQLLPAPRNTDDLRASVESTQMSASSVRWLVLDVLVGHPGVHHLRGAATQSQQQAASASNFLTRKVVLPCEHV